MKRFLVGGVLAVILVLGVSVAGVSAWASSPVATARDTASTEGFIALQEQYDIDTIRSASAVNTAEHAFEAQIRARCPGVLAHLPTKLTNRQGGAVSGFLDEAVLALDISAFAPMRTVIDHIAAGQRRLRFSDPALQWQVRVDGAANAAYFALRPPDLCTDGRLLARSVFTQITPAAKRFVVEALTVGSSAATSPSTLVRAMRSYAPAAAATALKRLPQLQHTLNHAIPITAQSEALLRVLGLRDHATINFAWPGVTS